MIREAYAASNRLAEIQFDWADPDVAAIFEELDVTPGLGYFLVRAAPLGAAAPEVVAASFAFFPPLMVAKLVGRARVANPPDLVLATARSRLTAAAERRYGGDADVAAAADLVEHAVDATDTSGRALAAAWKAQRWDEHPAGRLFTATTMLREHRGDGHVHALTASGLSALAGRLLATARRGRPVVDEAKRFGWREEDLAPASAALEQRGALRDGEITAAGRDLWEEVEALTDDLSRSPWDSLGGRLGDATSLLERIGARMGSYAVAADAQDGPA